MFHRSAHLLGGPKCQSFLAQFSLNNPLREHSLCLKIGVNVVCGEHAVVGAQVLRKLVDLDEMDVDVAIAKVLEVVDYLPLRGP
ncbi:MAG: hypothetical protein ACRD3Q_09995, partial [Terriglobales bacterium]